MKLKAIALAVSLSFFGASAFAADLDATLVDVAVIAGDGTALLAVQDLAVAGMASGGNVTGGDLAMIVQEGTLLSNVAMITQQASDGTQMAAIVQTNTVAAAVGYIAQSGTDNRAFISQHD